MPEVASQNLQQSSREVHGDDKCCTGGGGSGGSTMGKLGLWVPGPGAAPTPCCCLRCMPLA
jgi:hypothetical protein